MKLPISAQRSIFGLCKINKCQRVIKVSKIFIFLTLMAFFNLLQKVYDKKMNP